jgi:hypothetical protein
LAARLALSNAVLSIAALDVTLGSGNPRLAFTVQ